VDDGWKQSIPKSFAERSWLEMCARRLHIFEVGPMCLWFDPVSLTYGILPPLQQELLDALCVSFARSMQWVQSRPMPERHAALLQLKEWNKQWQGVPSSEQEMHWNLYLQSVRTCNLSCPYCSHSQTHGPPATVMSEETACKALDRFMLWAPQDIQAIRVRLGIG